MPSSPFLAGDFVRVRENRDAWGLTEGHVYTVRSLDPEGGTDHIPRIYVTDDYGEDRAFYEHRFEVVGRDCAAFRRKRGG